MQRAAIPANVLENIHEAKVLQSMTAFGGITWLTCVDVLVR